MNRNVVVDRRIESNNQFSKTLSHFSEALGKRTHSSNCAMQSTRSSQSMAKVRVSSNIQCEFISDYETINSFIGTATVSLAGVVVVAGSSSQSLPSLSSAIPSARNRPSSLSSSD